MATAPFLIADNSPAAQEQVDKMQHQVLPIVNAVLAAWRTLDFPRNIASQEDVVDLLGYTEERITEERKKQIPATLSALNPNKALSLMDEPVGLLSLRAAAAEARSIGIMWNLMQYNSTAQAFEMKPAAVAAYIESHKQYATGKQVDAITALEKVRDGVNELLALGIPVNPRKLLATPEYGSFPTPLLHLMPLNGGGSTAQIREYAFSQQINP